MAKNVTPAKKKTSSKPSHKAVSQAAATPTMRSFRVYKDSQPFTRPRLTRQTFYWIVLLLFIVVIQLWILSIQVEIARLNDAILTM